MEEPERGIDSLGFVFYVLNSQYLLPSLHWCNTRRGEAGSLYGVLIDICTSIWHGNFWAPAWKELVFAKPILYLESP